MAKEPDSDGIVKKRVFVGGLFPEVSENEIKGLFKSFGNISSVDIIRRKDNEAEDKVLKTFAYVNIDGSEKNIKKCISVYSKTKWKGHELKLQIAKESYLSRLRREKEASMKEEHAKQNEVKSYEEITSKISKTKAAVPGTEIKDERNWIVGKFGRALPVVYIREKGIGKVRKFDPSKHCHQLRKLKDDFGNGELKSVEDLTWFIEEKEKKDSKKNKDRKENEDSVSLSKKGACLKKSEKKRKLNDASCLNEEINSKSKSTNKTKLLYNSDSESEEVVSIIKKPKIDEFKGKKKAKCPSKSVLETDLIESNSRNTESKKSPNSDLDNSERISKLKPEKFNDTSKLDNEMLEASDSSKEDTDSSSSDESDDIDEIHQTVQLSFLPAVANSDSREINEFLKQANNVKNASFIDFNETKPSVGTIYLPGPMQNLNESWESFMKGEIEAKKDNTTSAVLGESIISQIASLKRSNVKNESKVSESKLQSMNDHDKISDIKVNSPVKGKTMQENEDVKKQLGRSSWSSGLNRNEKAKKAVDKQDDTGLEDSEDDMSDEDSSSTSQSDASEDDACSPKELHVVHKMARNQEINHDKGNGDVLSKSSTGKQSSLSNKDKKEVMIRKEFSEEKRLKSLTEREEKEKERRNLVKNALHNIDLKIGDNQQKHVKFESSDEDAPDKDAEGKKKKTEEFEKVTGSAAVSWLGLSSSDDSDEENDNRHDFSLKPQFEGEHGEKLFKLQNKMGLDTRFKIDERFLESEDEAGAEVKESTARKYSDDDDDGGKDNVNDYDLKAEKFNALSILENILGKRTSKLVKEPKTTETMPQNLVRYDPLREDHAIYEIKDESTDTRKGDTDKGKETKEVDALKGGKEISLDEGKENPSVSREKFFNVTDSIKDLFQNKESSTFSFLKNDEENVEELKKSNDKAVDIPAKVSKFHKILEDDQQESMDFEEDNVNSQDISSIPERFFFTKDDPRLQSDAIDGPAAFMRLDSYEEISKNWEENKQELRMDYKKKHKDALRRRKKLNEKRTIIK